MSLKFCELERAPASGEALLSAARAQPAMSTPQVDSVVLIWHRRTAGQETKEGSGMALHIHSRAP